MEKKPDFEIHFAPIQGMTDATYRNLHAALFRGIDAYYTPFIRVEQGNTFRPKDIRECEPRVNCVPRLVPQVLGGEPDELRLSLKMLQDMGYRQADINLGCPFPMIARRGKGAGLLPSPERVEALLRVLEEFKEMQCSVKMRLGWEKTEECLALLPLLNAAPLSAIILHARVGVQGYKGETNPEGFGAFLKGCKHSLFYNGDLRTTEDIQAIRERFPGIRGVMIGRGLLANPALAEEFTDRKALSPEERALRFRRFHDDLFAAYSARLQGDAHLLRKMQAFWEEFMPWTNRKLLKQIHKCTKIARYHEAVNAIFTAEREGA